MAVSGKVYPKGMLNIMEGDIDLVSDTIKGALMTSSHSWNDTHENWSSISANEASGTGYTAGGQTLTSKALSLVDSSTLTAWQSSTAYALGDLVRKTTDDGHVYLCVDPGTSGGSEPTWVTDKFEDTTDNTVIWSEFGAGYVKWTSDQLQWTNSTITARYVIFYQSTSGLLIAQLDLGENMSSSGGNFTVTPPGSGWFNTCSGS